jgi:hypothetical protein
MAILCGVAFFSGFSVLLGCILLYLIRGVVWCVSAARGVFACLFYGVRIANMNHVLCKYYTDHFSPREHFIRTRFQELLVFRS